MLASHCGPVSEVSHQPSLQLGAEDDNHDSGHQDAERLEDRRNKRSSGLGGLVRALNVVPRPITMNVTVNNALARSVLGWSGPGERVEAARDKTQP